MKQTNAVNLTLKGQIPKYIPPYRDEDGTSYLIMAVAQACPDSSAAVRPVVDKEEDVGHGDAHVQNHVSFYHFHDKVNCMGKDCTFSPYQTTDHDYINHYTNLPES